MPNIQIESCWRWPYTHRQSDQRPTIRSRYVYRLLYEVATGEKLAPRMILHHTCENSWCVNPFHLEPMSQSSHMKEHDQGGDWGQAKKTHCPQGHPYDEENTYRYTRSRDGKTVHERYCRACMANYRDAYRRRSKLTTDN